jgi:hypothetical protein
MGQDRYTSRLVLAPPVTTKALLGLITAKTNEPDLQALAAAIAAEANALDQAGYDVAQLLPITRGIAGGEVSSSFTATHGALLLGRLRG